MATKPTKPRVWTEDEIKLLMELGHLKESLVCNGVRSSDVQLALG